VELFDLMPARDRPKHILTPHAADHSTLRNKLTVHDALPLDNSSILRFKRSSYNFVALGNDRNFHIEDSCLFSGLYRKHTVLSPVTFAGKAGSLSAVYELTLILTFLCQHS
jgi:hypothetical protein